MSTEKSITIEDLSTRKKILLYFDYLATVHTGGKATISQEDLGVVIKSLQTEKGAKIYEKFLAMDHRVKYALGTLLQARLSYREQLAIIDGLVALKEQLKDTEALINEVFTQITDPELRNRLTPILTKKLPRRMDQFWIMKHQNAEPPDVKLPDVKIDVRYTVKESGEYKQPIGIDDKIRDHKAKAETALIYFKTFLKAVRDSMKQNRFQIPRYLEIFKQTEKDMMQRGKEANFPEAYPDYKTVKIDEAQYEYFRKEVI